MDVDWHLSLKSLEKLQMKILLRRYSTSDGDFVRFWIISSFQVYSVNLVMSLLYKFQLN